MTETASKRQHFKHSPYLSNVLENKASHQLCVQKTLSTLSQIDDTFDAIACTGVSGLMLGPTIAYLMHKRLAILRKKSDVPRYFNHGDTFLEHGLEHGDRVLILDDLIASGDTIKRIQTAIHDCWPTAQVIGHYLYRDEIYEKGEF